MDTEHRGTRESDTDTQTEWERWHRFSRVTSVSTQRAAARRYADVHLKSFQVHRVNIPPPLFFHSPHEPNLQTGSRQPHRWKEIKKEKKKKDTRRQIVCLKG